MIDAGTATLRRLLLISLLGLLLGSGVQATAVWLEPGWPFWAGMALLLGGAAAAVATVGLAARALWRCNRRRRVAGVAMALAVAALLASGVEGATAAARWHTRFLVTVRNEGDGPARDVQLAGGGETSVLGELPPGEQRPAVLWFHTDGELALAFVDGGGMQHREVVEGYVTSGLGGSLEIALMGDGSVRVRRAD